jgi:hypothetical protein
MIQHSNLLVLRQRLLHKRAQQVRIRMVFNRRHRVQLLFYDFGDSRH